MRYGIKPILGCIIAAALIGAGGLAVPADGPQAAGTARAIPWRALSFGASKWLNRVSTHIELRTVDAAAVAAAVVSERGQPLEASATVIERIDIHTAIEPAVGTGVRLEKKFWFDPGRGNVLFGESLRSGQQEYLRRFRFTGQGVFRFRREPASRGQAAQPPGQWTDTKASFYAYDLQKWGCRQVVEPSVLIYLIAAADFSRSDFSADYCVFHKRHLFRVNLRGAGSQTVEADYTEVSRTQPVRRTGPLAAIKLAMTAQPLGDYQGEVEDYSFLGFKDNIELYVDPARRLPVMICGRIPTLGQARLKLTQVVLAD